MATDPIKADELAALCAVSLAFEEELCWILAFRRADLDVPQDTYLVLVVLTF
jgi:hypothetical protein